MLLQSCQLLCAPSQRHTPKVGERSTLRGSETTCVSGGPAERSFQSGTRLGGQLEGLGEQAQRLFTRGLVDAALQVTDGAGAQAGACGEASWVSPRARRWVSRTLPRLLVSKRRLEPCRRHVRSETQGLRAATGRQVS